MCVCVCVCVFWAVKWLRRKQPEGGAVQKAIKCTLLVFYVVVFFILFKICIALAFACVRVCAECVCVSVSVRECVLHSFAHLNF